jgi:hypothetical protein
VNGKNGTEIDEVIKEQAKVDLFGQQMSVTNFVHKNWYAFCSKNEIKVSMSTAQDGTITEVVKIRYILHNFIYSFTLKIITTVFCTPYGTLIHE